MTHSHDTHDPYWVSKSQKKRDSSALQDLGEKLAVLSPERLKKVPMSERLLEALLQYQRLPKHEAQRRQMQFIGRLMRDEDPEPIRAALAAFAGQSRTETARMHRLEDLRTRFIADETVINEIASAHPDADFLRLRQLRRNAIKEHTENRPPRAFREIFRILRDLDSNAAGSAGDTGYSEENVDE